ncbi:alpha/beta fold hydrolase [Streptomyces luomodiensis]|uniref:alpha/beta fold hydrolase n=1 Tax=Streptomyces luomodiensis TaxID=3026192 RepID=UPI003D76C134
MPSLAGRFHVIAIDLPGQGHSERPKRSYDTHTVAAHVHAAVKALGASTYWLVAHDIGAWVAFSPALNFESQLRGVALLDAGIPGITLPEAIHRPGSGVEDLAFRVPHCARPARDAARWSRTGIRRLVPEGEGPLSRHVRRRRARPLRSGRRRRRWPPRFPRLLPRRRRVTGDESRCVTRAAAAAPRLGSRGWHGTGRSRPLRGR